MAALPLSLSSEVAPAARTPVALSIAIAEDLNSTSALAAVLWVSRMGSAQPATGKDWLITSFAVAIVGGTALAGGSISGGMIPKVETCINAIQGETEAAHILDGRVPHVLLLEVFTEHGVGTMIKSI